MSNLIEWSEAQRISDLEYKLRKLEQRIISIEQSQQHVNVNLLTEREIELQKHISIPDWLFG